MAEACRAVEPLLSAWLDGELGGRDAQLVAAHLAACDSCTEMLDDLGSVASVLGNLPVRRAPEDLAAPPPEPAGPPASTARRVRALAVATGLLVGAAFALGGGDGGERPVPAPLDALVTDGSGETPRGQTGAPVILETVP